MSSKKTDNHNLPAKLALRRHFLRKYHQGTALDPNAPAGAKSSSPGTARPTISVLDCCQATGKIWGTLQREFPLAGYWGVDLKPKKGRLAIDSVKILDQPGWTQNVVDVDTYGSPWKHWFALLRNCKHPVTVFLTIGLCVGGGGSHCDRMVAEALGLEFEKLKLTPGLGAKMNALGVEWIPRMAGKYLRAIEIVEALNPGGHCRYLGVRLEPR